MDHLGFSRPAGQFSRATGMIHFSSEAPFQSSVDVTIDLSTLQTGLADLDEVFRSPEFFDTSKYPTATFKSQRVESGAEAGSLKVSGLLDLHGMTKPVTLAVKIVKIGANPRNGLPTRIRRDQPIESFGIRAWRLRSQVGDKISIAHHHRSD